MSAGRRRAGAVLGFVLVLLAAALVPSPASGAGEARRYEYMRIQGRIGELPAEVPVSGVTVRIRSGSSEFETTTDARGAFVFDDVPVATYEVEVTAADGKALRAPRTLPSGATDRTRVRFRFDYGATTPIRVEPDGERVTVTVPRQTDWRKVGAEFAVFVGIAGLLAL